MLVPLILAGLLRGADPSAAALEAQVPSASRPAVEAGLRAWRHAAAAGPTPRPDVLTVIDYSRPSTEPRLFVFDLASNRLLFRERVAHGRESGGNATQRFSNASGSRMSSLGVFRALDEYPGTHGPSLRLEGLEPGFNDHARERAIVLHGADYVSDALVASQGRLGRSWGCPAVRPAVAKRLIETIRGGSLLVAYYPDAGWLRRSAFLARETGPAKESSTAEGPSPAR
ncbi:MAG TPA: murein L,D-transpeptidase catalytic domain family protein [Thermoanaerobaculia bacterium]|jgi:hypothetical protein|nr:murein L,D-transpeptidase catalytic domain family protein [Thermoanaerobaculia bacterium]